MGVTRRLFRQPPYQQRPKGNQDNQVAVAAKEKDSSSSSLLELRSKLNGENALIAIVVVLIFWGIAAICLFAVETEKAIGWGWWLLVFGGFFGVAIASKP